MFERIAIIMLVNILYFLKSIGFKYVSDDIPVSQLPKDKNKWKHAFYVFEGRARSTPQIDHAITIALHSLTCVFIYLGFGVNDISFIAAFLFAFNPINNQGNVWISGRGYVFATLGVLMALSLPWLSPLILLWTTHFNVGFVSPIVLLFSPVPMTALSLPVCWWIHSKKFKKDVEHKVKMEMFKEDKEFKKEKFVVAIKTFGFYLTHAILPLKTTFYHSFLQSMAGAGKEKAYTIRDRFFWIGLIQILFILCYWFTHQWNMVSFGLLWWCIGIAPFLNFFRLSQEIAERYAYFPSAGLMFVLAYFLQGHPILQAVFITMYATRLWFFMDAYQDDFYVSEWSCLNSPNSWFAWHIKAVKRWEAGSHQEAAIMWSMARMISPKEFKILFNLAVVCRLGGHQKEALEWLEQARQHIPGGQELQSNQLIEDFKQGKQAVILI